MRHLRNFLDARRFLTDRGECVGDRGARTVDPRASDQVDQLAPADRRVVTVFGRLVEDGQQTIVKAHLPVVSFGRTLLLLYACIYNALSDENLTIP